MRREDKINDIEKTGWQRRDDKVLSLRSTRHRGEI